MADSEQPLVATPARRTISCLRLNALNRALDEQAPGAQTDLAIRTFPREYSPQNMVLLAHVATPTHT